MRRLLFFYLTICGGWFSRWIPCPSCQPQTHYFLLGIAYLLIRICPVMIDAHVFALNLSSSTALVTSATRSSLLLLLLRGIICFLPWQAEFPYFHLVGKNRQIESPMWCTSKHIYPGENRIYKKSLRLTNYLLSTPVFHQPLIISCSGRQSSKPSRLRQVRWGCKDW